MLTDERRHSLHFMSRVEFTIDWEDAKCMSTLRSGTQVAPHRHEDSAAPAWVPCGGLKLMLHSLADAHQK